MEKSYETKQLFSDGNNDIEIDGTVIGQISEFITRYGSRMILVKGRDNKTFAVLTTPQRVSKSTIMNRAVNLLLMDQQHPAMLEQMQTERITALDLYKKIALINVANGVDFAAMALLDGFSKSLRLPSIPESSLNMARLMGPDYV